MKRFVLLFVCAVVCLGVLAAPALAGEKVQTYRPPADTPIVWDAWWWEYSPSTGEFFDETTFFQAFDPNYPGLEDWFGAVPKGREVKLMAMWIGRLRVHEQGPEVRALHLRRDGPERRICRSAPWSAIFSIQGQPLARHGLAEVELRNLEVGAPGVNARRR